MRSNKRPIVYRRMKAGEETMAVDLVLKIFNTAVAPQFSQEGIAEFEKFVCADALADRSRAGNIVLLAESGQGIGGVIEMRENSHIALLFVDKPLERKGIATELVNRAVALCRKRNPDLLRITVNASPNAFHAYRKIGFQGVETEQVKNGIRFIPMEMIIDNKEQGKAVTGACILGVLRTGPGMKSFTVHLRAENMKI